MVQLSGVLDIGGPAGQHDLIKLSKDLYIIYKQELVT